MTYSTSHLGLSTLLIYGLLSEKRKNYLKSNPRLFLLLSFGSILPDLDIIFGGHRLISHSLLIPLFFVIITSQLPDRYADTRFNLLLFASMWLSHMLFDVGFGPMALFWPLDPRLFDFKFFLRLNLEGNWLLPVTVISLVFTFTPINTSVGGAQFWLNWTDSERIDYFGSDVYDLQISNFFIHVLMFSFYSNRVLYPVIKEFLENKNKNKIVNGSKNNRIFNNLTFSGLHSLFSLRIIALLAILLGAIYSGPVLGKEINEVQFQDVTFWSLTNNVNLARMIQVPNEENKQITITSTIKESIIDLTFFAIFLPKVEALEKFDFIDEKLDELKVDSISQEEFLLFHLGWVNDLRNVTGFNNLNNNWNYVSQESISILFGVSTWNITESFVETITVKTLWNFPRENSLISSYVVIIFDLIAIIVIVARRNIR